MQYSTGFILTVTLMVCMFFAPHTQANTDNIANETFSDEELASIKKDLAWPEMTYDNTLTMSTIESLHSKNLMGGRFNVEGYIIGTSNCLSPCSKEATCIAVCAPGIIISSTSTKREVHFTGHDVKTPHEMILFLYSRGRENMPQLDEFTLGEKYKFSLSKNPYHGELLGYEKIK